MNEKQYEDSDFHYHLFTDVLPVTTLFWANISTSIPYRHLKLNMPQTDLSILHAKSAAQ